MVFKFCNFVAEYIFTFQILKPPYQTIARKIYQPLNSHYSNLYFAIAVFFFNGGSVNNAILLLPSCVTMTLGSHSDS